MGRIQKESIRTDAENRRSDISGEVFIARDFYSLRPSDEYKKKDRFCRMQLS